ncbi:MAG TPA: hypothetical protein VFX58_18190, partial [Chitinophagaceae bacterium]|nr:hypothetical protein [Chitinophagaceae bacterium]
MPTGDSRYQDYFYRNDSTKVLAPVDQAIQLGDGGTGLTAELYAFYSLNRKINLFFSKLKGRSASQLEIRNSSDVMSVPDQFGVKTGFNLQLQRIAFTAGFRYEKVPVEDLIGGSQGFRRAASISSIEPGLIYKMKTSLFTSIPRYRLDVLPG